MPRFCPVASFLILCLAHYKWVGWPDNHIVTRWGVGGRRRSSDPHLLPHVLDKENFLLVRARWTLGASRPRTATGRPEVRMVCLDRT